STGAITRSRTRTVAREVRAGEEAAVAFPAPLGPVTFEMTTDRLTASWSSLPESGELGLSRSCSRLDPDLFYTLSLSTAFVEAPGATRAVLEHRDIPGFKSTWRNDPTDEWFVALESGRFTSDYDYESWQVSEWSEPTSMRRAPRGLAPS